MEKKMRAEYDGLIKTGMFYEIYPNLSGDYEKDKDFWEMEYRRLQKERNKYKSHGYFY